MTQRSPSVRFNSGGLHLVQMLLNHASQVDRVDDVISLNAFDCTLRCNSACTSFYRSSTFGSATCRDPGTIASVQMRETGADAAMNPKASTIFSNFHMCYPHSLSCNICKLGRNEGALCDGGHGMTIFIRFLRARRPHLHRSYSSLRHAGAWLFQQVSPCGCCWIAHRSRDL